jgi:hypothetical protein
MQPQCDSHKSQQQESRSQQRELFQAGDPDALKKGKKCSAPREDYFECLHQTKTRARMMTVLNEEEKQKKGGSSSGHHDGGH